MIHTGERFNYSLTMRQHFRISQLLLPNWIVAGFLFVDVIMISYQKLIELDGYLKKLKEYDYQIQALSVIQIPPMNKTARLNFINKQRYELTISWQTKNAVLSFNVRSRPQFFFVVGSRFFIVNGPAGLAVMFLLCAVAVAMYLSSREFGTYYQKSRRFKTQKIKLQ